MISTFFSWGGFFIIIPLVAVHYVDHLGWAASTVGLILAARQITQQGMTTLFGIVADSIGPKPLICTGMIVRTLGFAALAWSDTFVTVMASLVLAGLGGALFEAPKAAALAAFSTPQTRQRLFSTVGVVAGIGTTIGTQIGALLIPYDFAAVCLSGAAAYVIIFISTVFMLPPVSVATESHRPLAGVQMVFRDRRFMLFLVILIGFWFCSTQFGLTISLSATRITGTESAVSWIYAVNAIATIGLGYILPRLLERWLSPLGLLLSGVFCIGVGLLMIGFATTTFAVLVAAFVFSIGAILARPGQETVTANLAQPGARGTYFGVAALSLGIGGGLGNYLGGLIYSSSDAPEAPWIVFAGVATVTVISFLLYRRRYPEVAARPR